MIFTFNYFPAMSLSFTRAKEILRRRQSEVDMYGSSRLGILNRNNYVGLGSVVQGPGNHYYISYTRGMKYYELTNHLGNVLTVVSDRKNPFAKTTNQNVVDFYVADIKSVRDYYPFGMEMPGRKYTSSSYRYESNGKELDKEITSTTTYDYGFRIYSPGLGKFLSVDPLTRNYPWYTPYQFAGNTPIQAIDLDGLEVYGVYNKATSLLFLIPDLSKVNPKLSYKYVSAIDFDKLTDEDKAKTNYGIVVKNVFTGGHFDGNQIVHGDPTRPKEKPISTGTYNILENKGNTNPDHNSFFVLDPQDKSQFDKVDDRPGEINSDGEKRSGYNLHPGRISWGCVTICKNAPDLTPEQREQEWNIINKVINNTHTEQVADNRGMQKYVPFSRQMKFGTLKVIDMEPPSHAPPTSIKTPQNQTEN